MFTEFSLNSLSHAILSSKILLALALVSCYIIGLAIYRLFISPLASIPGPKIAGRFHIPPGASSVIFKARQSLDECVANT